jgi:hypothetical protein
MDVEKIIFVFNKFYTCLIKDVKKNTDDNLKDIIRKHYKAIDKLSPEYIEFFISSCNSKFNESVEELEKYEILKDIKLGDILPVINENQDKEVFWNYYYILAVLALVYVEYKKEESENKDTNEVKINPVDILSQAVLDILTKKQKGDDVTDDISVILHDDIQALLLKIKQVVLDSSSSSSSSTKDKTTEPNPFMNLFKGMEDSKICNLAQEISNDIDVSNLKLDSSEDIMKLLDFSNSNNIMGDIIKKVSSRMHDKISNGELKQEDLFGEAMSMMGKMNMGGGAAGGGAGGSFGGLAGLMNMMGGAGGAGVGGGGGGLAEMMGGMMNNPMVSEMMKAAKKGKAKPNPEVFKGASSRDRLRKKLDEKRKQKQTSEV